MKSCTLRIKDQVNIKFEDVDPGTRRAICEATKFDVPSARHTPLYKMGRWDGKKHFATSGGASYVNMLDRIIPVIYEAGYEVTLVDERPDWTIEFPEVSENILSHKTWPAGHPLAGEPIVLRDYQVEAIRTYFKHKQSIQEISTGAGKTLITASISYLCEEHGRTIVVVPSKDLVTQTEEDFRNLGLDVGVYFGDRKEYGHRHTISTWQSLGEMAKNSRQGEAEVTIDEMLDDVICVQVDEGHTAKADVLFKLLAGPMGRIPLRWGMSGTVPKEDFAFAQILCGIGPLVGCIRAKTLQDQGVLSKCFVHVEQLDDSHVNYASYPDEFRYLTTDPVRLSYIARRVQEIAVSGNTLVLVQNIEPGKFIHNLIPDSVFIHGSVKSKDRKAEYKEVQTTDNKVIVATYGVAAVGINIPRLFNLVILEAGKSDVKVIQSIGRVLRKAADKDYADIYDFCSSCKFSKKHLTERKKKYDYAEYPYVIKKVKYR